MRSAEEKYIIHQNNDLSQPSLGTLRFRESQENYFTCDFFKNETLQHVLLPPRAPNGQPNVFIVIPKHNEDFSILCCVIASLICENFSNITPSESKELTNFRFTLRPLNSSTVSVLLTLTNDPLNNALIAENINQALRSKRWEAEVFKPKILTNNGPLLSFFGNSNHVAPPLMAQPPMAMAQPPVAPPTQLYVIADEPVYYVLPGTLFYYQQPTIQPLGYFPPPQY